jgi:hypothetical protein
MLLLEDSVIRRGGAHLGGGGDSPEPKYSAVAKCSDRRMHGEDSRSLARLKTMVEADMEIHD